MAEPGTLGGAFHTSPDADLTSTPDEARGYSLQEARKGGAALLKIEEDHRRLLEDHTANPLTSITGAWRFDTGTGVLAAKAKDALSQSLTPEIDFDLKKNLQADKEFFPANSWEHSMISQAKSQTHYEILKGRITDRREYLLNAEDMGVLPSIGLQLVAEVANVPNWIGLGALAKVDKLRRVVLAGLATGGLNVAEEKLIDTEYHDRHAANYIAAGALGMGLGWLGVKALPGDAAKAANIDKTATDFAETHLKNATEEAAERVNPAKPESTAGAKFTGDVYDILGEGTPGRVTPRMDAESPFVQDAAQSTLDGTNKKVEKLFTEKVGVASMGQSVHSSDNPLTRHLGGILFEHPEGVDVLNKHTVALDADLKFTQFIGTYAPEYVRIKAAWNELASKTEIKHTFDEAGIARLEDSAPSPHSTPEMDDLIEELQELYTRVNSATQQHMKDSGVMEAAENLDATHVSRGWDPKKFSAMRNKYGDATCVDTLKQSILDGNDFMSHFKRAEEAWSVKQAGEEAAQTGKIAETEAKLKEAKAKDDPLDVTDSGLRNAAKVERITAKLKKLQEMGPKITPRKSPDVDQIATRMAQALYNRFLKRSTSTTADANLLSSANRTLLMDALKDAKLDSNTMFHIKYILDTSGKDHMANPMKHQMGMKLDHAHPEGLRVMDFMYSDLGNAFASKQRYWIGRSAAAKKGLTSEAAFQEAIEQVKAHGSDRGMEDADILADVKRLEAGWSLIMGKPIEDMSAMGQTAMRITRKAMAASSLGKLGIVQAGETGRVMAAVGIENILDTIPAMRQMIKGMIDGSMDTASLVDIQRWATGKIGAEHYMGHPDFRADDMGHDINRFEKALDKANYWLQTASGWNAVHTAQKKFLMDGLGQKWYREFTQDLISDVQLRTLGVTPWQKEMLKKQFKKHARPIPDSDSGAMHLHLGDWDPETRDVFAQMLHRKGSNAVQDIIVGETPLWINHGVGKFLGQFRSFSIAALGKQTIRDYRMFKEGDKEAALAFQFMLMTSLMATTAKIGFESLSRPEKDRKAYLKRNLDIRTLTTRTLQYHGQTGPVMDAVSQLGSSFMPNAWGELTGTSQWYNGRGAMSNVPGISYINKAAKGVLGVAKAVLPGEEMSKSEWKAFTGALPLGNWYGTQFLNKRVITPMMFKEN